MSPRFIIVESQIILKEEQVNTMYHNLLLQ